ncbi:MAG TPA: endolytic transglycosylase MltG [Paenibacillaceae bacterium]
MDIDRYADAPAVRAPEGDGEPSSNKARRKRKKNWHPMMWSFFIALGLVLVSAGGVLYYVWNGLRPPAPGGEPVRVTVERGMRAQQVAELLEQHGLIRDAWLFGAWLKWKGEGSRFQAGIYEFVPGTSREEIVRKLNVGETVAPATFRFTIPEGLTIRQMADRLEKAGAVSADEFLRAARDLSRFAEFEWVRAIPADAGIIEPLEGYLFPETYEMRTGSTAEDIIRRMLAELDRKLGSLPEDWMETMEERGLTLHELLTIASLIEREVAVDKERPLVSSVIANRLEKGMPLQIDATIQYVLDEPKERLLEEDLKVESPYNTYLNKGLPPGPIAAPGLKSIEAALYPADTDYLYYVTKKDGSGEHLFASTLSQHNRNIRTSEENARKLQQQQQGQ